MESETYSGYQEFMPYLITTFRPDYVVGSVHFVDDLGFDYSQEQYERTAAAAGRQGRSCTAAILTSSMKCFSSSNHRWSAISI